MATESAKHRPRLKRVIAVSSRWLHIYLSMGSFVLVFFFAATGLTLNHPDWFAGQRRTSERHGTIPKAMLQFRGPDGVDRLGIVELLREHERVHGTMSDFRVDDTQIVVSLRAPGYTADAFIDRVSGSYDLTVVQNGLVAVLNDLHKGRDAGKSWGVLIDISAVLLVMVSVTGLVLIWFVYKRRSSALLLATFTAIAVILLWRFEVP